MKKLMVKAMILKEELKTAAARFAAEEDGDFSIKGIAGIVAVIVIIGVIVGVVSNNMDGWIGELWDKFQEMIDGYGA